MPSVYRPLVNFVATAMQAVLNLALLCLGSSGGFPRERDVPSGACPVYSGTGQ